MKRYDFQYSDRRQCWCVFDRKRGHKNASLDNRPMAECAHADDAEKIVDALNAQVPA